MLCAFGGSLQKLSLMCAGQQLHAVLQAALAEARAAGLSVPAYVELQ